MNIELNRIRNKISDLRAEMLSLEGEIRKQIDRDEDCSENAGRVLDMRAELNALIGQRISLGDTQRLMAAPILHRKHETKIARGY
ncbi:MAG: hypothetical protein ACOY4O_16780 [Pseudomonadota bacterium]